VQYGEKGFVNRKQIKTDSDSDYLFGIILHTKYKYACEEKIILTINKS
jgi:hypothetical protein